MLLPASAQTSRSFAKKKIPQHSLLRHKASLAVRAIRYVGGKAPHIVVTPSELVPYTSQDVYPHGRDGRVFRHTPYGAVQIYWHVDQGTEDGSVISKPDEIHQYSTITHFAIISPPNLPVTARLEMPDDQRWSLAWLRINGMVPSYYLPGGIDKQHPNYVLVKLHGGLNIVQAGLHDAE
jgi:hypothetical protein